MSKSNVIDFLEYKADRRRDRDVQHWLDSEAREQFPALATFADQAASAEMRDDIADFTAAWMNEFNRVVTDIQEVIYDIDVLLGEEDQEPPL